ncbi:hypothetical protein [Mesorhizobium sp.]|uniref:hypothetical protein n=1 Tax=Mesorhizobium sp. TaxID=1871066 RepID=UPI000FE8359A|nr:hypothetical protein [Mesorhizobium sp.]RWE29406.1 MAG: hypothetical protein EOS77_23040 [Mesorhizobium sp.]
MNRDKPPDSMLGLGKRLLPIWVDRKAAEIQLAAVGQALAAGLWDLPTERPPGDIRECKVLVAGALSNGASPGNSTFLGARLCHR